MTEYTHTTISDVESSAKTPSSAGFEVTTRKTAVLMFVTMFSRILGFVRIAIISFFFGASVQADIIHLVFSIPNNLRKLLAEGALSTAFIPIFSQVLMRNQGHYAAKSLVAKIFAFQFIVLLPLLLFSTIFPEISIRFFLDLNEPALRASAAELFRYLIHYILLVSFSAVIMGVLNSYDEFLIPGIVPLLFSISVIVSLLLYHQRLGIFAIAVGVLAGGLLQLLFQLPKFLKLGYRIILDMRFNDPDFRLVLSNWLPILSCSAIFAINQQIAFRFASAMDVGSATALNTAIVFWQLPYGIFSASIVTVLFPRMSRQIAAGMRDETAKTVQFGISALITFLLPASVGLFFMAPDIISVALFRGNFHLEDVRLSAEVLLYFTPGLIFVGINTFLQKLHFSDNDLRTPIINAIIITTLDILLSLWLKETTLKIRGLALANTISYAIANIYFLFWTKKRFPQMTMRPIVNDCLRIILAVMPAIGIMFLGQLIYGDYWKNGSNIVTFLKFISIAIPAAGSVFTMFKFLRLNTMSLIIKKMRVDN